MKRQTKKLNSKKTHSSSNNAYSLFNLSFCMYIWL